MTSVSVTTTKNTVTVNGETRVVTVKTRGPQGPSLPDGDKGDVTVSSNGTAISINNSAVTSAKIADGAIVDADINASAAIALSKLATGALPTAITVTSANISDLSIVNADINASAAIAGTKISPDFGSQNIVTTGTGATGALGVTGNITVSGTVDGRDVAADGTKLDGIESGATADQTASEILTLIKTVDGTGSGLDADTLDGISSASFVRSDEDDTMTGNLTLSNTGPKLIFNDTDNNSDFRIKVQGGSFLIEDTTNSNADRFEIASDGTVDVYGNLDVGAGLDVTGNISVTGTVDGRDVATDGTKLDTLSANTIQNGTSFVSVSNNADITISRAGSTRFTATGAGVDVTGDLTITNNLTVTGNFTVNGTTTTIDTTTLTVEDKNIELGKVSTPTDTTADGGGITLKGATDKTFQWLDATDSWTSSEHIALPDNKKLQLGASQDLQIYHDGNNSVIKNSTGYLNINSGQFAIGNQDNSEFYLGAVVNQGVELRYDNVKKFETTSTGITVTAKTQIEGGSGDTELILKRTNTAGSNGNSFGTIKFNDENNNTIGRISTIRSTAADDGDITFATRPTGGSLTERLRILSTGNITVSGTVDGRDLATDGTKLDGIESNATADQTASDIKTLLDSSGLVNAQIDASAAIAGTKISPDFGSQNIATTGALDIGANAAIFGTLTISNATPTLIFTEDDANPDYRILTAGGDFVIQNDQSGSFATRFKVNPDGHVDVTGNLDVGAGIDVTGEITATSHIDLPDNAKIKIGTGDDLQIYHDGDNSYIIDIGTGSLILGGDRIRLRSSTGEDGIEMLQDGAVELYYDNAKKLETTSSGTTISGNLIANTASGRSTELHASGLGITRDSKTLDLNANYAGANTHSQINSTNTQLRLGISNSDTLRVTADSIILTDDKKAIFGTGSDLQIYHNGTNSYFDNSTGHIYLRLNVTGSSQENAIKCTQNGNVEISYDGSKKLETTSSGATVTGAINSTVAGGNNTLTIETTTSGDPKVSLNAAGSGGHDIEYIRSSNTLNFKQGGGSVRMSIAADGTVNVVNNLDVGAGIDVTGAITGTTNLTIGGASSIFAENNLRFKSAGDAFIDHNTTGQDIKFRVSNSSSLDTTPVTIQSDGQVNVGGMQFYQSNNAAIPIDNAQFKLGAGDDLKLYHDGTHSYIKNETGSLFVLGDAIKLRNEAGTEAYIECFANGAVKLSYDDSIKLQTTSGGVSVTGNVDCDGIRMLDSAEIRLGTGDDIKFFHDGNNSKITHSGSGGLYIGADTLGLQKGDHSENYITMAANGAVELYYDGSRKIRTKTAGIEIEGELGMADNYKIKLGTGEDLQIYHDGTHSYVDNTSGSGNLYLKDEIVRVRAATSFAVDNADGTETSLMATLNGAAELYYDNSKKFETKSFGAQVTGELYSDGLRTGDNEKIRIGDGEDLQIYHDGSNSRIHNTTGELIFRTGSNYVFYNSDGTEKHAKFISDGAVELYYDNVKRLETKSWGVEFIGDLENNSDSSRIKLGVGDDLQIYHDGSDSIITNSTGDLKITDTSDDITITAADDIRLRPQGGENGILVIGNGPAELYYDNSKKFETTNSGVTVTGTINFGSGMGSGLSSNGFNINFADSDGAQDMAKFGNSGDLQIYHDGVHSRIVDTGTGDIKLQTDFLSIANTGNTEHMAKFIENGDVELYYDNSKKFETTSTGISVTGHVGINTASTDQALHVIGTGDDTVPVRVESTGITSRIGFQATGTANSYNVACGAAAEDFTIYTSNTERMRVNSDGRVMINTTTDTFDSVTGNLNIANTNFNNYTVINLSRNTASDRSQIRFSNTNGNVGSINTSGSATSYNTSSDYRLKENATAISDGITRLKTLKPYRFNFKADATTTVDGFFAHEVTAVPEAITGTKDEVNENNDPVYQGIDQSKLVPLLVAAVQELIGRVEKLEGA